jgi:bifunctional non-homologous end joining protein LigD
VGGYTALKGRTEMRALVVGFHDAEGRLIYAGRVGSGFDEAAARAIEVRLHAISRQTCPFAVVPPKESGCDVHWVLPQLVVQVRFAGWSRDGMLRHPVFTAMRDDQDPSEVVRETTVAANGCATSKPDSKPRRTASPALEPVRANLAGVSLTNPGKLLYPDAGITKLDLVRFYVEIADWILPHLVNRPLTLVRCPDGVKGQTFYQRHAGPETPQGVGRVLLPKHDATREFLFVSDLKGLVSLVQIGTLEIHPWGSLTDEPDRPDRMIFDLDPDSAVPWPAVVQAALRIRERLRDGGLTSFVKTTGGKGLHIVCPLERRQTWDDVAHYSQQLAKALAADYPKSYTVNPSKQARPGRIYLDYRRNSEGATAVAAYSTRARPGAPVATPLAWDELSSPELRPDLYTVQNLATRLTSLTADPWREFTKIRQALGAYAVKKR